MHRLESCDWEYFVPLREEIEYRMEGGIVADERSVSDGGDVNDRLAFQIGLYDGESLVARVTNRWILRRGS